MSDWKLKEGERLDDLVRDGMKLIQRPDQFCFSIDSVLLAHYPAIKGKDKDKK
jgi:tRNA1Val (adenine37-N6)-methyltransferase